MEIRNARKADARHLAYLINLAGEGIPEYLWAAMAGTGESAIDVGAGRAARKDGSFSYTNARVCAEGGTLLGMILSYRQPDPYEMGDLAAYPEVVRPLIALEAQAPGSWYINAIATYEQHRGKGVARMLTDDTETRARLQGCDCLSLIVASENTSASGMYGYMGFKDVASAPVIPYTGCLHGGDWILMTKQLRGA